MSSHANLISASCLTSLLLAGCAGVGPDYSAPTAQTLQAWSRLGTVGVPDPTEGLAQWWHQLGDPQLDRLIDEALAASPDLAAARARLAQARALRDVAGADRFPTVTASISRNRSRGSREIGSGAPRDLYRAGFDASWEPDVFGGQARGLEAAQADLEASAASLGHTRVSLVAEVALNYVELRAFQTRQAVARANQASQAETLQLTEWRAQAGLTTFLDVEQARGNLAQTTALLPTLATGEAQAQHRLAVLTGQAPGALIERLATPTPMPVLPERIAVGIPAQTLGQRPDVAAAERSLAAATARVGEAQAARYPSFNLSGSLGLEALSAGALGSGGALARALVAGINAPVFDAGRLASQVDAREAARQEAEAHWRQAVLTALEEVENALVALAGSRQRGRALGTAREAADMAAQLARQRYAAGLIDFQTVLDTERSLLSVEDSLATTRSEAATALIQLYKALGGGWSAGALPEEHRP
ncbi:MAG: efflux transporter outer membrane subunit [Rhodocyclaceae bacterium]|nr:efflux transporter outer membrane subunit [Rhodocyclaceae bacterium]